MVTKMHLHLALFGMLVFTDGVNGAASSGTTCTADSDCTGEICGDGGMCGVDCSTNGDADCETTIEKCLGTTKRVCTATLGGGCPSGDTNCGTDQACGDANVCVVTCADVSTCTTATQICTSKTTGARLFCRVTLGKTCSADSGCGTNEACGDGNTCVAMCADVSTCTAATHICESKTTGARSFCRVTLTKACTADSGCGTNEACGDGNTCVATCADVSTCTAATQICTTKTTGAKTLCRVTLGKTCSADSGCGTNEACGNGNTCTCVAKSGGTTLSGTSMLLLLPLLLITLIKNSN